MADTSRIDARVAIIHTRISSLEKQRDSSYKSLLLTLEVMEAKHISYSDSGNTANVLSRIAEINAEINTLLVTLDLLRVLKGN